MNLDRQTLFLLGGVLALLIVASIIGAILKARVKGESGRRVVVAPQCRVGTTQHGPTRLIRWLLGKSCGELADHRQYIGLRKRVSVGWSCR